MRGKKGRGEELRREGGNGHTRKTMENIIYIFMTAIIFQKLKYHNKYNLHITTL